ncbi:hypothetical protein ACOAOT_16790 [Lacrimispora sp. AGF001]|uniref:hypothetical protein n=1 Tax=Lacrimispora sp. AGF001 TaxID=3401631 RepID=UPI003B436FD7
MRRKMLMTASLISLAMIGSIEGGITSFAQGPGEATTTTSTETTNVNINTYYQSAVAGLGNWEQQSDNNWKFKLNTGGYLTRSWVESLTESGAFYYVNDYGVMSISATTPDGFTVDSTGLYRTTTKASSGASNSSTADNGNSGNSNTGSSKYDDLFNEDFMQSLKDNNIDKIPSGENTPWR